MLAEKLVFDTHCMRCHGVTGGSDGPEAGSYRRPPASLHKLKVSFPRAASVLFAAANKGANDRPDR